uniref:Methyltransferase n=1 Tax=viral metagenome TaxID=1070528 RepID=A0A6C0K3M8_9ZZZZ
MPSIDLAFLLTLKDDITQYHCFIETGTYNGDTTFSIEPYFNTVYTIEFSEKYYRNTKNRYNGNKIQFILGDSSIVFNTLLPTLTDRCIFFLDGHWSCGDTGRSEKDCPLVEEITHINNLFRNDAIIIIDDYRVFGTDTWQNINKEHLLSILEKRITNMYHLDSECAKDDRLIIHIKKISE